MTSLGLLNLNFSVSFRFMPSFLRLGSWNIVMFVTYEQIKRGMTRVQHSWESPF